MTDYLIEKRENNTLSCTLILKVEKVEMKANGTLNIVLKNTESTEGEEQWINKLIALQRTGDVVVNFEAMQHRLDL